MRAELNFIKVRKFTEEVQFDEQAWQSGTMTKLVVSLQARKEGVFFFLFFGAYRKAFNVRV